MTLTGRTFLAKFHHMTLSSMRPNTSSGVSLDHVVCLTGVVIRLSNTIEVDQLRVACSTSVIGSLCMAVFCDWQLLANGPHVTIQCVRCVRGLKQTFIGELPPTAPTRPIY